MRIRNRVRFLLLTGLVCCGLKAQLPTAVALGVVTDDSGAVVPGASITFRNQETGQTRTAETDGAGSYRLPALNVGNYEVRISKDGFQTTVMPNITLTVSQEATINATLKVGAVGQTVEVQASAQTVNTDSSTLGGTMSEQKVQDLPLNGRNFVQLTLQEIGVVQNSSYNFSAGFTGVMINANGGSIRSNNWLLDGSPAQNYYGANNSSISGTTLGLDGIREFRILTSGLGAEYGGTMGAQVLMVSKGGSNQLHGSAFEFLRNSALVARSPFDPKDPPPFRRNNFGGSLGGPIRKDKTFIFGTYEALISRTGLTQVDNVLGAGCHGPAGAVITNVACPQLANTASVTVSPTIASILGVFPLPNLPNNQFSYGFNEPNNEHYGQVRIDHNFSNKDTLFGRYTVDNDDQTAPLAYPGFKIIEFSRNQYITAAENHIFSPALLNTLRFSYMETLLSTDSPTGLIGPGYSFIKGLEMGSVGVGGTTGMSAEPTSPAYFNQYLEHYSDDIFYTKGRHSLKFGASLIRYDLPFLNNTNLRGAVSFANVANFLTATASSYNEANPASTHDRDYFYMTMGFYAEDDFKVSKRLTLNLGLRYEPGTVPAEATGRSSAVRKPTTDTQATVGPLWRNYMTKNWSPRVGFAWDVFGDAKTSLRGSFARLEDVNDMGGVLDISANGTAPFATILSCGTPTVITLPLSYTSCVNATAPSQRTPNYYMEQPHLLTYNLSLQRQLPWDSLLTVAYAGSRGLNLMNTLEYNPIIPQVVNGQPFWPLGATTRINPNFGYIGLNTSEASSWYNSLQVEVLKRLSSGMQFQLSYTRSRAIGNTQSQLGSDNTAVSPYNTNPLNYHQDYGPLTFNTPNNFRFNAIYNIPNVNARGLMGGLLKGWWMSTLVAVQTGLPFTVALNTNRSRSGISGGSGGIDRPNLAPGFNAGNITSGTTGAGCLGVPANKPVGTPTLFFNPCAFQLQPQGTLGNAGVDILEAPGQRNVDFSLVKDTGISKLGEGTKLQFRAEVFNLLNHPFYSFPNRIVYAGTAAGSGYVEPALSSAGVITSILGTARQLQLALKLVF